MPSLCENTSTAARPLRVLILEDRPSDARLLVHELRQAGYEPTWQRVQSEAEYLSQLNPAWDLILADYSLPQFDALSALHLLHQRGLEIPFIVVSGTIDEDLAVAAIREGAADYLLKDRLGRLGPAVAQALRRRELAEEKSLDQQQIRVQTSALAAAANGILITDRDGKILWVNPAFTTITGYSSDEVLGNSPRLLKSGQHDEEFYEELWQTILAGQVWSGEIINRRKDGRCYVEEQTITPVFDAPGQVSHFIAIKQDISDRKRDEQTLSERIRLATLGSEIALAITSSGTVRDLLQRCTESMVRNLDAAFARIWTLNGSRDTLELQASAGLYTHIDGPHGRVPVGALKIGLIAQQRQPHLTNNVLEDPRVGDQEWARREGMVAFAGYPLIVEEHLVGVMAMFARHRLSSATLDAMASVAKQIGLGIERKESEDRLRFTQFSIDHMATAVFWSDAEARFFNVNAAACGLTGYTRDELLALRIYDIDPSMTPARWEDHWNEIRRRGALSFESCLRPKGGAEIPISINTNLLQLDGKECSCTFVQDISERKQLEEQFRQAQKMEAVGKLAGGIAHDFNNLLTIIAGYSDVLLDELHAGDPLREFVEEIDNAASRAATLTRQLLAFSRKQVLAPVVLNLNALVEQMKNMLGRLIGEDVDLALALAAGLWPVRVDAGQMEQVIMNLVVNARDAMPQGGKLTIQTANVVLDAAYAATHTEARPGEYVVLAVSDAGCGMDRATLTRIFEPFFTTKGPDKGTGLGLATVHGIVKQSEGHIEVYSEPGYGTSFKIYIPRDAEDPAAAREVNNSTAQLSGRETILLVEDEEAVRTLARRILARHGYEILEARDGAEALAVSQRYEGAIDLLATDVVMPNMSGREVAERLAVLRPATKVLFMSGYMDDAVVRHGLLHAGVPFLQKPYTPDSLAQKVRHVLDQN